MLNAECGGIVFYYNCSIALEDGNKKKGDMSSAYLMVSGGGR